MQKLKQKTVSEKIHAQLTNNRSRHASDSSESDDDGGGGGSTKPRLSEFDENNTELERASRRGLSDIRKQNVQLLDSVDRKYQGRVSSRKEAFNDDNDSSGSGEDDDESSADGEDSVEPGAFVRLKVSEKSEEEDEDTDEDEAQSVEVESDETDSGANSEDGSESDDDEYDQFSLGDFLGSSNDQSNSQKLLQDENRQEMVQKGICVQNQLKMWERLLEMRIKIQPALITANSLPHSDKFDAFRRDEKFQQGAEEMMKTVESTLGNLLELQSLMADQFPETKSLFKAGGKRKSKCSPEIKKSKNPRLQELETILDDNFSSFKSYQNDVIQKWHDRVKASSNIKNANQSMNIVRKIESSLLAKDELIRKTQQYRGGYELFEKVAPTSTATETGLEPSDTGDPEPVYSGEIFDDSDFYHALLRELIEFKSNTAENPLEIGAKLAELQKLRSKMKKQVDTRASKGRKIRYVVHKKLVNFTAPENNHEWTEEAKNELFSSLFGGTTSGVTENGAS